MGTPAEAAGPLELNSLILIMGAGRLGLHLAAHLRMAGVERLELWNRSPLTDARRALWSLRLPSATAPPPLHVGSLPHHALEQARLVLLTVGDDAIEPMARLLAEAPRFPTDCPVLHCSGALNSTVLEPLALRGHPVGSMHPLQSFSGTPVAGGIHGTWFALEGDGPARGAAAQLVSWFGGIPITVREDGKVLYHTAAVVASNLLVALVSVAVELLSLATDADAHHRLQLLLPLIEGTVSNLRRHGLPQALTGPISRGDVGVVARQLEALRATAPGTPEDDDRLRIYRDLSQRALQLARAQGLPSDVCATLEQILA